MSLGFLILLSQTFTGAANRNATLITVAGGLITAPIVKFGDERRNGANKDKSPSEERPST